jgi:GNAT superfamily N-acetyltransferase
MEGIMNIMELRRGEYLISTDRSKLDISTIHEFLSRSSYWAQDRTLETVMTSINHSLNFGVYLDDQQVGFARVVTDFATFAWLCDVFILEQYRGRGLAKWLVKTIVELPELQNLKHVLLATRDAHQLYRRYGGFEILDSKGRLMRRST